MRLPTHAAAWLLALSALTAAPATAQSIWRGPKPFDPLVTQPGVPAALAADDATGLWIVQADAVPTQGWRDALTAVGATLFHYVPENAYAVRMDAATAARVAGVDGTRWVGAFHPAWRLQPGLIPQALAGGPGDVRVVAMLVDRFGDVPALTAGVTALGGRVLHADQEGSSIAELEVPFASLAAVARLDQVIWLERWTPAEVDMDNARIQGGGNYIETAGGYTGQGVIGHVHEGVEAGHPDFNTAPQPILSSNTSEAHGHATAGIVFGNGTSNPRVRGMSPDATFYFTNYATQSVPVTMRGPVFTSLRSFQVSFTTASWGNARTTYYTAISADADQAIFDADMIWTQSQSNSGGTPSRPQAWAKNVMSIGGVHHNDNSNPADDSWARGGASTGPAADGRIKPDLCAYYDSIGTSDLSGSSGYSSGNWTSGFGGTSGATPIVAGHNALAIQMFTDGLFGNTLRVPGGTRFQNKPHAPTQKALMIAAAKQYTFSSGSTDNRRIHQGWGFPDLRAMYDDRQKFLIVDETDVITQGQVNRYTLRVGPNQPLVKVALTWADPPGLPNDPTGAPVLVNDLDLRLIDPSGNTTYLGNVGLQSGMWSTSGGTRDSIDSVECVFVQNPAQGDWTIEVAAPRIAVDGRPETGPTDADYGLVARGGVDPNAGGGGGGCRQVFSDDNQAGSGSCNFVPFGTVTGTALANQKYQTIVRAGTLGGQPGDITGLAFAPCGAGLREHARIRIRMSHVPNGYQLQAAFAQNVPNPVTVLESRDWRWPNERSTWSRIGLMAPFAYDGSSDLVIEIEVEGSNFNSSPEEFRAANRERVSAFGWTGSPPASGTVLSGGALKMRLEFACASVNRQGTPCSQFTMTWTGTPRLGQTFDVGVTNALPNGFVYLNFGYDNRPPIFPLDMGFLGVPGCKVWHDALAVLRANTDANGDASLSIPVPNLPVIVGGVMYAQALLTDTSLPGGAATSDYIRCVFGN